MLNLCKWMISKLPLLLFILLPIGFIIYPFVDTFIYTQETYPQLGSTKSFGYHLGKNFASYLPATHTGMLLLSLASLIGGCLYSVIQHVYHYYMKVRSV